MEEVTQRLWQREGVGRLTVSGEQRWYLLRNAGARSSGTLGLMC